MSQPKPTNAKVFVAFYTDFYEPVHEHDLISNIVKKYSPPFVHCSISFSPLEFPEYCAANFIKINEPLKDQLLCTSVTRITNGIKHGLYKYPKQGYTWIELSTPKANVIQALNVIKLIDKSSAMHLPTMLGLPCLAYSEKPTVNTTHWTCVTLTGFLLQQLRLLDSKINPYYLSVTELYLILRKHPTFKSISMPIKSAFAKSSITDADMMYILEMNLAGRHEMFNKLN
jgi:hypothetical protein